MKFESNPLNMELTDKEKANVIKFFFNTKAQQAYQRHFGFKAAPDQEAV